MYRHTHTHSNQESRLSKHGNSYGWGGGVMMSESSCLATHHMSSGQVHYDSRGGNTHLLADYSSDVEPTDIHTHTHTLPHACKNMRHLMNMTHLLQRAWNVAWGKFEPFDLVTCRVSVNVLNGVCEDVHCWSFVAYKTLKHNAECQRVSVCVWQRGNKSENLIMCSYEELPGNISYEHFALWADFPVRAFPFHCLWEAEKSQ